MHSHLSRRARLISTLPRFLLASLAALALWAAAAQAHAADHVPPVLRLGDDVRPLAQALTLRLDPRQEPFNGRIAIDVELARPLDFFWINATGLSVQRAILETAQGPLAATTFAANDQFLGVQLPREVPAGRARLLMEFSGRMSSVASRGVFRQQDLGEWYAFSQFESTNARKAFPSFDEPHWKTPWTVALEVPHGLVAVSNTPQAAREPIDAAWDRVAFATTQPLPSYLVAFGVGPFEIVDGGRAGRKQTPLRYIVPKGRAAEARFAKEATPRLLGLLEDYFGMPYPFEKLDSMAIPLTLSFSAMENPGLITYRANILLADAQREDDRFHQLYASVGAHEMAHQWFGDLVTMRWWDDIWLNESFATWMADKIRARYDPAWESGLRREESRQEAFATDRLPSTRQVRQPVRTRDDLANAFDSITYSKGGALLRMYEAWIGADAFRDGVRRHLAQHAFGNAGAEDFFAAIGQSDPLAARSFNAFVTQPGVPLLDLQVDCTSPRSPAAVLRQQRFLPGRAQTTRQSWLLPVCVRTEAGRSCTMLTEREGRLPLPGGQCPAWVLPNPAGQGYFLTRMQPAALHATAAAALEPLEAIAFMHEQAQLARSGALPVATLLDMVAALARDPRPAVVTAAAEAVTTPHPALFTPMQLQQRADWIRATFGATARRIGWRPAPGDTDADRKLRDAVLPLVAGVGEDEALQAQARELATAWLEGDRTTLGGQWRWPLRVALLEADEALVDKVLGVIARTDDRKTREDLWASLAFIRPVAAVTHAFHAALAPAQDFRESANVFTQARELPMAAPALLDFVTRHEADLRLRTPAELLARQPRLLAKVCSPAGRSQVQALYGPGQPSVPGQARNLALALEEIDVCLRARDHAGQ